MILKNLYFQTVNQDGTEISTWQLYLLFEYIEICFEERIYQTNCLDVHHYAMPLLNHNP